MAQFVLNWFAAPVMVNPNSVSQRALYRQKSVGGSFISTGFTPTNDLPTTTQSTTSPNLGTNIIWEFKVQAICTEGGPTDNNNGIVEGLKFECLTPNIATTTITTATIVLNISGLDITKASFTLHLTSDDSVVYGPVVVNPSGSAITTTATGLTPDTEYYWEYTLYSTVNGVEIQSTSVEQLGVACFSDDFSTPEDVCLPCTALTAEAEEV